MLSSFPHNTAAVLLLLASAAGTTSALSGCHIRPVPGKVGLAPQKTAKVVAKGFTLQNYVRVTSLEAERVNGGLLEVKLAMENVHSKDMWCDIQAVFYDEGGFEAEKTNWQPLRMASHEITHFRTASLSSAVSDFSILLRNPRREKIK